MCAGVRRLVKAFVSRWAHEEMADQSALCVQELLSNVVKHTSSPWCVLTLDRCLDRVRVTLSDTSTEPPVKRESGWCAEGGRGLVIVDGMADAWGVDFDVQGAGKSVWFEMRTTPEQEAA